MSDSQTTTWEPWQPSIGQAVRIRLNPECNAPDDVVHAWNEWKGPEGRGYSMPTTMRIRVHFPQSDGAVGVVRNFVVRPNGHDYLVDYPADLGDGTHRRQSWFTAGELEPVEELQP